MHYIATAARSSDSAEDVLAWYYHVASVKMKPHWPQIDQAEVLYFTDAPTMTLARINYADPRMVKMLRELAEHSPQKRAEMLAEAKIADMGK